jgi:threonine dehydratase
MSVRVSDVEAAARRQDGRIVRTPLLESLALNNMTAARILVKAECLQTAGSFKIRGALNRLLCLRPEQRERGVVAFSSGNFGQGLAAASGMLGVGCTIVMPGDAPVNKQERARSYGATVELSEVIDGVNREITAAELAKQLASERGLTLLHPFEDAEVIAGQGTCALEICEQCAEKSLPTSLDALLIPAGGGGLSAGCCLAMESRMPQAEVFIVEPDGYDDHVRSLNSEGRTSRLSVEGAPPTLCDSLQAVAPGENTWPINRRLVSGGISVNDDEVRAAMIVAFETLQIVLEPGGATGLAAVLSGKVPGGVAGRTIGVVASGGNLNLAKFAKVLGCAAFGGGGAQQAAKEDANANPGALDKARTLPLPLPPDHSAGVVAAARPRDTGSAGMPSPRPPSSGRRHFPQSGSWGGPC